MCKIPRGWQHVQYNTQSIDFHPTLPHVAATAGYTRASKTDGWLFSVSAQKGWEARTCFDNNCGRVARKVDKKWLQALRYSTHSWKDGGQIVATSTVVQYTHMDLQAAPWLTVHLVSLFKASQKDQLSARGWEIQFTPCLLWRKSTLSHIHKNNGND